MQEAGSRTEKIGQVTLDYTYYPGEDYYCDGAVEDEILEIVQNNPAECFEKIIREKKSWPVLPETKRFSRSARAPVPSPVFSRRSARR